MVNEIIEELKKLYPNPHCTLDYNTDYELLFNTRLSAQCTDLRVNKTTPALYAKYPTLESLATANVCDVEELVKSCGFYHHKARDIVQGAKMLLEDFDAKIPDNMSDLLKIPGVGRKTANLILGELFLKPAIVADTHCIRLSNRFGFCNTKNPEKVEQTLREIIPETEQLNFCHRLVYHGRAVCKARGPDCENCTLQDLCAFCKNN